MSTSVSLPTRSAALHRMLPVRSAEPDTPLQESWKAELQARLQAHRQRRAEPSSAAGEPGAPVFRRGSMQGSAVAARVAERYRHAPSYQELLTASAEAAQTAAEAALEAHAAAAAALAASEKAEAPPHTPFRSQNDGSADAEPFFCEPDELVTQGPRIAATVEHPVPLPERPAPPPRPSATRRARTLVDAFAEAVVPAAQSLPAKLIEFPRELVAPRKQRPRLAEGPLLVQEAPGVHLRIFEVSTGEVSTGEVSTGEVSTGEVSTGEVSTGEVSTGEINVGDESGPIVANTLPSTLPDAPGAPQIRAPRWIGTYGGQGVNYGEDQEPLDEVREPLQAAEPDARTGGGWASIRLGEHPRAEAPAAPAAHGRRPEHGYGTELAPALHDLAPLTSRLMSALVDAGLVFGSFLLAVLLFASCTTHVPAGKAALGLALLVLVVLAAFYGWLFMSFGGGSTPGMRYTRIAICTFADSNPTRRELQGRVPATALAMLPLGLGVLWAILDEDKLGWHDRMTRTYQRSYK